MPATRHTAQKVVVLRALKNTIKDSIRATSLGRWYPARGAAISELLPELF
jgi:hypothetical protein